MKKIKVKAVHHKELCKRAWQYAQDIVDKKIPASKYMIGICKTLLKDKERVVNDRWIYREECVYKFLDFCQVTKHIKGPYAGQIYVPDPWQTLIYIGIFCFVDKDDEAVRRYKELIIFMGRKNGKTWLLTTIILYNIIYSTAAIEIYSLATKKEQSKIVFDACETILKQLPAEVVGKCFSNISKIYNDITDATFKPLASNSRKLDGLACEIAIFDESSQIKDKQLFSVIQSSQGSASSALTIHITTASSEKQTYFYELLTLAKKISTGKHKDKDNHILPFLYLLEEDQDFTDEKLWICANPGLGTALSLEHVRKELKDALLFPSMKGEFLTKRVNVYSRASVAWLQDEDIKPLMTKELNFADREIAIGVDIGQKSDFTAVTVVGKSNTINGEWIASTQCFLPEKSMENVPKHLQQLYEKMVEEGDLNLHEGKIVNLNYISDYIADLYSTIHATYGVKANIYLDPWQAGQIMADLEEKKIKCTAVRQNMQTLSPPTKQLETMIFEKRLKINQEIMKWQCENCELYTDINDNIKVRKDEDENWLKVDSIVALVFAISGLGYDAGPKKKRVFKVA